MTAGVGGSPVLPYQSTGNLSIEEVRFGHRSEDRFIRGFYDGQWVDFSSIQEAVDLRCQAVELGYGEYDGFVISQYGQFRIYGQGPNNTRINRTLQHEAVRAMHGTQLHLANLWVSGQVHMSSAETLVMQNCIVTAAGGAYAVGAFGVDYVYLSQCLIKGAGVSTEYGQAMNIGVRGADAIEIHNSVVEDANIAFYDASQMYLNGICYYNVAYVTYEDDIPLYISSSNVFEADPLIEYDGQRWHIDPNSPCIGTGSAMGAADIGPNFD